MKTIKNIGYLILITTVSLLNGCTSSFDDYNTNPDAATSVPPSMLATDLILGHVKGAYSDNSEFMSKRMFWGEQMDNYQYNRVEKGSFGSIRNLTNAQKMVELASDDDEAYHGLFYYLKGWTFFRTTLEMGDIPYSETLQVNKFRNPKYDEQKDVFIGILSDLELAEKHFANAKSFAGDPFYKGDPQLWRKATNVLRLKVLMALQKRAEDTPELKVKETFKKIVDEGNLFASNADNLQVVYSDKDGQKNPLHKENRKSIEVYAGTTTIIDPLKKFGDYRLFYYFAPAQALTDKLYLPEGQTLLERSDLNAYNGLDAAGAFNTEQKKISTRMHNRPNDVYRNSYVGVPSIRLGYADMNFILAEAAERGWINGSAKSYYEEGIRASFLFVKTTVPNDPNYTQGIMISDEYIADYLKGKDVSFKSEGSSTDRLKQIWIQAYLASYFHLAWDSYYEYRRTGYPELPINPETNLNDDKNKIPVRWLYPESESNYNKEQLKKALERQWGGAEDVNKVMWVLK